MNIEELKELYLDGFPTDSEQYAKWFIDNQDEENVITYSEDGVLLSAGYILYKQARLFKKKVNVPFLAAISTLSLYRGKKKVANVINNALQTLYNRGDEICFLYPFNHEYYLQYGFNNATFVEMREIRGGINFQVREGFENSLDIISDIYDEMIDDSNAFLYSKDRLQQILVASKIDNGKLYIYYDGSSPFAFAFVENGEIQIYGYNDLNKFMKINDLKGKKFAYYQGNTPYLQARIINVKQFLTNYIYKVDIEGRMIVKFEDDIIPQNNITLSLFIEKGKSYIKETDEYPTKTFNMSELVEYVFSGKRLFNKQDFMMQDKF